MEHVHAMPCVHCSGAAMASEMHIEMSLVHKHTIRTQSHTQTHTFLGD